MARRIFGVIVVAALAGSIGGMSPVASPLRSDTVVAASSPAPVTSTETGIHFTSKTIMVPHATVVKYLTGISPTGAFKFKSDTGALALLKAGKVMLLQGSDALLVKSVSQSHGDLIVQTSPAGLTDVISSGHITFSGTPDFKNAFLSPIVVPPPAKKAQASADFAPPRYPYVGRPPAQRNARKAVSFSAQGTTGLFGYSLTFTPSSATRLDVSGTLCFISTSVCGNGPSNGLSAEINLKGYIDAGKASGGITVNGGGVTHSSISMIGLTGDAHITYTVSRGTGAAANGDPPVFHIPLGIDYTIPGEIPIYLKLQTALFLQLGVSSKNAVIHGGITLTNTSSDSLTQNGKSISDSDTGERIHGTVLDQSDGGVPASISAAPSGVLVSVQFPKLGVGLGVTSVNGLAYVDMVTTVGQTTGAAIAGMICSSYDIDISIGAGLEAQIGLGKLGLSVASARKTLYDKTFKTHDPGCPQT